MLATVALTWGGWHSGVPYHFPEWWRHIDNANVMEPNVTASATPKANTRVTGLHRQSIHDLNLQVLDWTWSDSKCKPNFLKGLRRAELMRNQIIRVYVGCAWEISVQLWSLSSISSFYCLSDLMPIIKPPTKRLFQKLHRPTEWLGSFTALPKKVSVTYGNFQTLQKQKTSGFRVDEEPKWNNI